MVRKGWLREDRVEGLFWGGWRYWDCFLERRIWSNFPETAPGMEPLLAWEKRRWGIGVEEDAFACGSDA